MNSRFSFRNLLFLFSNISDGPSPTSAASCLVEPVSDVIDARNEKDLLELAIQFSP